MSHPLPEAIAQLMKCRIVGVALSRAEVNSSAGPSSLSARSNRSVGSQGSRPQMSGRTNPATDRSADTYRTYMSTARVHTALAALSAEKQALLHKLQVIDSALEAGQKKQVSVHKK